MAASDNSRFVHDFGPGWIGDRISGRDFSEIGAHAVQPPLDQHRVQLAIGVGRGNLPLSSVLFVKGMSNGELSVLFPLVSLGYVCTLVWSRLFFHEAITG